MLTISLIILVLYLIIPTTISLIRISRIKKPEGKKADVYYTYVDRTRKLRRRE